MLLSNSLAVLYTTTVGLTVRSMYGKFGTDAYQWTLGPVSRKPFYANFGRSDQFTSAEQLWPLLKVAEWFPLGQSCSAGVNWSLPLKLALEGFRETGPWSGAYAWLGCVHVPGACHHSLLSRPWRADQAMRQGFDSSLIHPLTHCPMNLLAAIRGAIRSDGVDERTDLYKGYKAPTR